MIYQTTEIARDVRVALDQNMTSEKLLAEEDVDTLSLEDIIESKIVEAVRRVETSVPVSMLDSGQNFGDSLFWGDRESGWVMLPDDFMRLMAFKMSDWERVVTEAITVEDAEYIKQSSRYKGIRGNIQRPVCAIVPRPQGRVLEFYSCKDESAEVSIGVYRPYPKIDKNGGVEISERCYMAVIYTIAGLVLLTMGESEKATLLFEISKSAVEQ